MTENPQDEKLNEILSNARSLPREIDPPASAWVAIKAEIAKAGVPGDTPLHRTPYVWQRPAFLIAAGLALVASSSLVTIGAMKDRIVSKMPVAAASRRSTVGPGPATFAEFVSVENDYISSANQLSTLLESERSTLSPETVAKLKQSLAIIDGAIVEARRALAADPANRALIEMLNTSYNQKIDLLKRTTEMGRT
ncbi:MAG: hypothetical protein ABIZ36_13125 [Gemmatimonadaceae bacterium]